MLSSGQEFDEKFLDSKHVLKVNFKPSRKNKDFVFLPVPILPGWLKILHLSRYVLSLNISYVFMLNEKENVLTLPSNDNHLIFLSYTRAVGSGGV